MQSRPLGRSGIAMPPVMFGGNVFGWTADEATSFRLLDRLLDAGLTAIDTADIYSAWAPGHQGGESEAVIGRWLRAREARYRVVIATKVGGRMGPDREGLGAGWIARAAEDSLRRLGTDRIDLYQSHFDDPDTPQEETLGAFARLIEAGKVRAIGASNHDAARLRSALEMSERLGLPRYESLQPHYNLVERARYEGELETLCRERELGVIPYFALAAGFLTGKYRSRDDLAGSARGRNVEKYLDGRGTRVLAALDEASSRLGVRPGQVAIAWLIARPGITAPIASATSEAQLDELIAAARLELDAETVAALDAAGA